MRSYRYCKLNSFCKDFTTTTSTQSTTTTEIYPAVLNENQGFSAAKNINDDQSPVTLRGSGMVQCSPCRGLLGKITCLYALPECKLKKSLPDCTVQCIGYFGCIVQSLGDTLFGETCSKKKQLEVTQAPTSYNGDAMSGDGDVSEYGSGEFDLDIYEENSGMPQNYVDPDFYENSGDTEAGNTNREELLINFQDGGEPTRTRNNLEQLFS